MQKLEELLVQVLNLGSGWVVNSLEVDGRVKEIDIYVEFTDDVSFFPGTKEVVKVYDRGPMRRIRHLDLFEYKTFINARIPRVKNKESDIRNIALSWADERVSFSSLFESKVIEVLQMSKKGYTTQTYSFPHRLHKQFY